MSKFRASIRLVHAVWVLAHEGVLAALPADSLTGLPAFGHRLAKWLARPRTKKFDGAENMTRAMNKLGPSYIKLGQFLATRPDIVGSDVANKLAELQDHLSTFSNEEAIAQIEQSLGRKIDDLFVEFGEPIAAASMAQVHPATVRDGDGNLRKVAVKVIRPNVRQRFAKDLESFLMVARWQERYVKASRRLRPVTVVETLAQTTKIEMDLRLEAAAISEMAENIIDDEGFRVPVVDWERTGRDVLTMEWIDGIKMSDVEALKDAGFDTNTLATTLMQSFLSHTLRDGFFHADMHPGNLFVDASGCIVAVDFGITGRLGKKEKRFLAEILYGFIYRDYRRVAEVHFEAGYVPNHHDIASFAQANRAIGEPIHGQSAQTISMAKLLTLLFEITQLFDMETRPELLLLQKTMVVVEGVSRTLNPQFNMWKASEPIVSQWMITNMGPIGYAKDIRDGLKSLTKLAQKTPELVQSFEQITDGLAKTAVEGLHLDDKTVKKFSALQAKRDRSLKILMTIIAICMIVIVIRLYCL